MKPKSTVPTPPTETPTNEEGQKLVWKGARQYVHSLFKLEPAKMLKNAHWNPHTPRLVEIEHLHFFHSHDRKGQAQTQTNKVGGHYHEIKLVMANSADGSPAVKSVECGPPMKISSERMPSGRRRKVVKQVSWIDENRDGIEVKDDHRHDVAYQHSELLFVQGSQPISAEQRRLMGEEPSRSIPGLDIKE